nr:MAG TPA: hypothetical protein [Caudoviricetes sp.]
MRGLHFGDVKVISASRKVTPYKSESNLATYIQIKA